MQFLDDASVESVAAVGSPERDGDVSDRPSSPGGGPAPKRSRNGPRGRRFCITFFGPAPAGVPDGFRDGVGDGRSAPGPQARSGQEGSNASEAGGDRGVGLADQEEEEEASAVDSRSSGSDEGEVQGGVVRVEPELSPLSQAAEELAARFRELLLKDKQVHRGHFWVEWNIGWQSFSVVAVVHTFHRSRPSKLMRSFKKSGVSFPDINVSVSHETLSEVYDMACSYQACGLTLIVSPFFSYLRPSDRVFHLLG